MGNNGQIDNADYYRLPCGRYLEDFIAWRGLDFAEGSALKYCYRAGHKDGETADKDLAKMRHYVRFLAARRGQPVEDVEIAVFALYKAAFDWDGEEG